MLESQHLLVVKALQKLYKHCINKEGFPGEPLVEAADGHPPTHAILDRLGLIKQAEESPDEPEENIAESLQYLRHLSTLTDCSDTVDQSSEPVSPLNPTPPNFEPPGSATADGTWRWGLQSVQQEQYCAYPARCDFSEMILRQEPGSIGSAAEISYHEPAPFAHAGQNDDMYGSRNNVDEMPIKSRLQTSVIAWPGVAGPPIDMFSGYEIPVQEQQQPPYPAPNTFARCNWTFPTV